MNVVLEQYNDFIHGGDPYIREFFFLRSIKPMVAFVSTYVAFVTFIGPLLMKNRKAINLRKVIILYNFCLVVYYAYFLLGGVYFLYQLGGQHIFCDSTLDSSKHPVIAQFYLHGYIFYSMRFIELVDTVFLVLSKKFKMITPLHVFHHSIVPVFGWFGFRSERSAYLAAFMCLNGLIHIVMYSYYAVAALGPKYQKYLWWKKYLTFVQIAQFFVASLYVVFIYLIGCTSSKFVFYSCLLLLIIFFFWFIDFYRKAFLSSERRKMHLNGEDKKLSITNNNYKAE